MTMKGIAFGFVIFASLFVPPAFAQTMSVTQSRCSGTTNTCTHTITNYVWSISENRWLVASVQTVVTPYRQMER